jgi:hypothetical protein
MRFLRAAASAGVGAALAAGAFAGDSTVKVPGLGSVSVKWNDLRYRRELIDQLQPGLTWRMGVNGATRIDVAGMALAGEGGILFPGEATLNLRYWSQEKWELVAFEENDWKWSDTYHQLGVVPCEVWREQDPKKAAEKLTLTLRAATGRTRAERPADVAVTGEPGKGRPEMAPPVAWSKEAQAEVDKAPWVEFEMRFGDLVGLVAFEAAEAGELKGRRGEAKTPFTLRFPRFRTLRAKTELAETGTEIAFGVLREETTPPSEWLLVVSGGALPEVELRRIARSDGARTIEGRRVEAKSDRREVGWSHDGKSLVLQLHGLNYEFPY